MAKFVPQEELSLVDQVRIRREQEQPVKQSTTLGTLEDQMEEAAKTKEEASS